jgi:glycosyltransferase involved in cell wall biosynthesis
LEPRTEFAVDPLNPISVSDVHVPTVSVILCTYNGEKYLPALLESLSAQTTAVERIVIRDDGSRDRSVPIVDEWCARHGVEMVHIQVPERRLGPALSFLATLTESRPAKLHLLADQDDVWLPDKIERAAVALRLAGPDPALYASRLQIVDASLHPIGLSSLPTSLTFHNAIYENQLTGCTMAINEAMRLLVCRGMPTSALMHDWWLYLIASAVDSIIYDDVPSLMYRQHAHNAVGAAPSGLRAIAGRTWRAASSRAGQRAAQLRDFGRLYKDLLPQAEQRLIQILTDDGASLDKRWRTAWTVPVIRRTWLDRLGTRVAIMRGLF